MTINLFELASKPSYEDVEKCSFGSIRIYHTPEPLIWSILPSEPRPKHPTIKMKTATGQVQERLSKLGDAEHEEYLAQLAQYDELVGDLQMAARYVFALRDVEYPDLDSVPPLFNESGATYPDHPLLRKKVWLDYSVLSKSGDLTKIQTAMMRLNGSNTEPESTEPTVNNIKKNSTSELTE